jgi:peptide/nickel transport system permease protein
MQLAARRLIEAAALLWVVLTITFVLLRVAPGDPADFLIPPGASAAEGERLRSELGLDRSTAEQYARWAGGVLRGDLGESFAQRRPVTAVLRDAIPYSLALGLISLALSFIIGIVVGAVQAARRGSVLDTSLTVLATAAYAAPSYWLALSLVALFTYGASIWGFPTPLRLPAFGVRDPAGEAVGLAAAVDMIRHAILPVVTLTVVGAAGIARYARTIIADVTGAQFVRTARAKGLATAPIQARHVLPNAAAPLIVLFALALPGVLAGAVFVETVFAWPGMGRAIVDAVAARDYPVVMGATALFGAAVILSNLAADLALPLIDPRRRE